MSLSHLIGDEHHKLMFYQNTFFAHLIRIPQHLRQLTLAQDFGNTKVYHTPPLKKAST